MSILTTAEKSGGPIIALEAVVEMRRGHGLLTELMGELESRKSLEVTTNCNQLELRNQVASLPPLILAWIINNRRLPTAEEGRQLLAAGDDTKAN